MRPLAKIPADDQQMTSSRVVLDRLIETTREAVIVVDQDLRIAACNDKAVEAFAGGIRPVGRRLTELLRDLALHQAFVNAIRDDKAAELRLELNTRERRRFDVHIAQVRIDGRNFGVGFFYDITKIERLESVRQEFLSNISHELRTPLTSILAFVETLENGALEDAENNLRFLGVIRRNAERMSSLIADILELSTIESGSASVDKRRISLRESIDNIYASLAAKAAIREVSLINDIEPEHSIFADPLRFEQMLVNLIENAIKFNRIGGTVTLTSESKGNYDAISVTDTGEGISTEHLSRIFERFYRVDRARSRELGGTGLGLAIVKHLALLHGGEVTVSSELSVGTTFKVELPSR
ncbi:MAG: PAS domain-containing protein [Blastocatellia bacterium]|nr:PAS domain-containing protein [Blastocatellia bacterium]